LIALRPQAITAADDAQSTTFIIGQIVDGQGAPVDGALVELRAGQAGRVLAEGESQPDGRYALPLPAEVAPNAQLSLYVSRSHFEEAVITLDSSAVEPLSRGQSVVVGELTLARRIGPGLWIAAGVFLLMLILIAATELHNTLAALLGAVLILGISYLGGAISEDLFIFEFDGALSYVDWNVIFLVMGMMIVIAIVERTGVFQWLAVKAYRISGGRPWLLLTILMLITGLASAFLDNVATMLLMTPITVQIALALGMNPLALLIPELMASNVIGVSTLVGTPTNILIGSFANISFNDFLVNLTPGVIMAFAGLLLYSLIAYRGDLRGRGRISEAMLERLTHRSQIEEPGDLRKALVVGAFMLVLFVAGERIHLLPAVTALMGATVLLFLVQPDIEEMIDSVDWTTLVFFISLFIVVGAIQEVGLLAWIAQLIGDLVGDNLPLAMLAVIWLSAVLSMVVANIPFTAAMLPVVGYLTLTIPGAHNKSLFYCLSVGAAMGGNGTSIGASANMVTLGIAERAGYPVTYGYFLKKGLPAVIITVTLATVWLFVRFVF
jgi:Na+/H+ antiporter NhaD/arsenite permease-like protein